MRIERAGGLISDSMETNDPPEQEGIVQVLPSTFSSFCNAWAFHMQIALDTEACVREACPPEYRKKPCSFENRPSFSRPPHGSSLACSPDDGRLV